MPKCHVFQTSEPFKIYEGGASYGTPLINFINAKQHWLTFAHYIFSKTTEQMKLGKQFPLRSQTLTEKRFWTFRSGLWSCRHFIFYWSFSKTTERTTMKIWYLHNFLLGQRCPLRKILNKFSPTGLDSWQLKYFFEFYSILYNAKMCSITRGHPITLRELTYLGTSINRHCRNLNCDG